MQSQGAGITSDKNKTSIKQINHLVIHDVVVEEVKKIVEVPEVKYITKEVELPVIKEVPTTKYIPKEEPTIKYIPKEEETVKYVTKNINCERPVITEKVYERPVIKDKEYERPTITERTYEVAVIKNLDDALKVIEVVDKLSEALIKLESHLNSLRKYTLTEEVIRVPKIEYFPVKVERIIWVDIKRERDLEKGV